MTTSRTVINTVAGLARKGPGLLQCSIDAAPGQPVPSPCPEFPAWPVDISLGTARFWHPVCADLDSFGSAPVPCFSPKPRDAGGVDALPLDGYAHAVIRHCLMQTWQHSGGPRQRANG